MQLTFHDSQVADFLEEMGAFLESYLAMLDAVSRNYSYNRNFLKQQHNFVHRNEGMGFVFLLLVCSAYFVKYKNCDLLHMGLN